MKFWFVFLFRVFELWHISTVFIRRLSVTILSYTLDRTYIQISQSFAACNT